ncbi:restriction endonuclease subunit S [Alcaligenes phenolicus]|uniref:Restriction endonuclease subunit S n=1 Tax=Alcaligenes phenolicus TaxID=232846 RepID=A0ABV2BJM6_9BURK
MSEVIPEGWSLEPLASCIAESIAGEWGIDANGDSNDIPVLRSTNFTNSGKIDYTKIVYRNIDARKRVKKKLNKGDIILEKSGGSPTQPVGRVVYFDRDTPFLYSNFTQKLVVQQGHDQKYVFYKFFAEYEDGTVLKFQQQTTGIINFQLSEYLSYQTLLAPLPEQQKIATILSSVDDVIEKTRAQIDKLKDLKTGMMQELLTQGIGHTAFKDSPVGRIPASWQSKLIDDIVSKVGSGITPKGGSESYVETGIPLIRSQNVYPDGLRLHDVSFITEKQHRKMINSRLVENDVLLNITGASIGRCHYLPTGFGEANVNQHVCILRPKSNLCNYEYLALFMNSNHGQSQIFSLQAGGNREGLNFRQIRSMQVLLPPLPEQIKIAELISGLAKKIQTMKNKLASLEWLKKALMQDLLTGKVRVKVNPTETAAA